MLEKVDLDRKLSKEVFKSTWPNLMDELGMAQRKAKELGIPVMIVFEGWDGAGKGTLMNELIQALDPRGFEVHNVKSDHEPLWPPMRRFFQITPPKGKIGIYNRSWYRRILDGDESDKVLEEITSFESQLAQAGYCIIKLFLHISKKEQRKRLKALEENPATAWRVTKEDWDNHKRYDKIAQTVERMIHQTDKGYAPWTIVESHQKEYATVKIGQSVLEQISSAIKRAEAEKDISPARFSGLGLRKDTRTSILRNLNMGLSLSEDAYRKELKSCQSRLREIQYHLYKLRKPLVIVFEGMDAAGKGGCIKRLTQNLDPRGYQVVPTAAPNDWERAHHYLWRFWNSFPKGGHIGVYDRSWYGRVLVERIEGFCTEPEWRRAFGEINEMEDQWADFGAVIIKFWLHITQEEQLRRFKERQENPLKQWKITEEDWRNRDKWDLYEEAAEEMFMRTSTPNAPWVLVEGNCKRFARIKVLKEVIKMAEAKLKL
ncbi:polyphosphate:AMP phosphotransferase [Thermanaerovibrio velox DSM 12556]|uniref:Polyphosphate:AMP phosphotransferase n=1 Tax=Thermanaerovibrio velox DSM 12556 TaxID=926567 RepID=H0UPE2_9BACT|nr:polyphosphate:AMP phosphotransferase [Thermanaerovibrio velox DSM 12556]